MTTLLQALIENGPSARRGDEISQLSPLLAALLTLPTTHITRNENGRLLEREREREPIGVCIIVNLPPGTARHAAWETTKRASKMCTFYMTKNSLRPAVRKTYIAMLRVVCLECRIVSTRIVHYHCISHLPTDRYDNAGYGLFWFIYFIIFLFLFAVSFAYNTIVGGWYLSTFCEAICGTFASCNLTFGNYGRKWLRGRFE